MLTQATINGMLEELEGALGNVTIVQDLGGTLSLDDNLSSSSTLICGYTNDGSKAIGVSWNTASGGSKSLNTSAESTPIMFAVPSGKTPTHIIFRNAAGTIRAIDPIDVPHSYTNDGPFYMYSYSIQMVESA